MPYFSPGGGQFGGGPYANPQTSGFMSPNMGGQFPGNWWEFSGMGSTPTGMAYGGVPTTTTPGPAGGTYQPGVGWVNKVHHYRPARPYAGGGRADQQKGGVGALINAFHQMREMSAKAGGGNVPDEWDADAVDVPKSSIDPMAVIRSAAPRLKEAMDRNMASAARRLGASGSLSGGGMGQAMGTAARKATGDIGELMMRTLAPAAEAQASREHSAQENALNRDLSSWGTHGNWEFQAGREANAQANEWQNQLPMLFNLLQQLGGQGYDVGPLDYGRLMQNPRDNPYSPFGSPDPRFPEEETT